MSEQLKIIAGGPNQNSVGHLYVQPWSFYSFAHYIIYIKITHYDIFRKTRSL